jgi:hypothetical protein
MSLDQPGKRLIVYLAQIRIEGHPQGSQPLQLVEISGRAGAVPGIQ